LVVWILISGLDDLFISLVYFLSRSRHFPWPADAPLQAAPERRIAIFVPLWHEREVIGEMLDHNLASIGYANYDIFVGVYPNDLPTVRAVNLAASRHPRVHVARCPHNGPTSKGDCLNWIYRRMVEFEEQQAVHFDLVVTHDAEDWIHADSLRLINWFSRDYEMVQIPVLPLPTHPADVTHGLYCDEFAEYQCKDIPVRQRLGGFLPANGVGTGFDRAALERLAASRNGKMFDPECLTEDYETGFLLHAQGCRQIFVPLRFGGPGLAKAGLAKVGLVATREYFPRRFRASVRQRSRWVAGIALQGWQHHGWHGPWRQVYWFWRDRKGLAGNLLSPVSTLFCFYGLASYMFSKCTGAPTNLGTHLAAWVSGAFCCTLCISLIQGGVRMQASAAVYGWRFALTVPARIPWGNLVNFAATVAALHQFLVARVQGRGLAWHKTEHVYPVAQLREAVAATLRVAS
jgi:adsorption protein B